MFASLRALELPGAHPLELVSNRTLPAAAISIYRTLSRPVHSSLIEAYTSELPLGPTRVRGHLKDRNNNLASLFHLTDLQVIL
ncbi:hypothetical protein NDU88_002054 [Pleurodeles waltl]|uniref:Uncharacterized protein n=1 Tax=Pleurodeles waltl TaxID=8319 RepID=A0AAV7W1D7_PLEWA|nr:hypothetical protein NDU88_002054 [Pleurodeles waltl]